MLADEVVGCFDLLGSGPWGVDGCEGLGDVPCVEGWVVH